MTIIVIIPVTKMIMAKAENDDSLADIHNKNDVIIYSHKRSNGNIYHHKTRRRLKRRLGLRITGGKDKTENGE